MAIKGVNRIILAVHNLEASKAFYKELLGAEFHEANWTGEAFGIHVAISWNAGIELCAPMPGREADCFLAPMLKNRGEGILNVVFDFDDADEPHARAKAMSIATINAVDYTQSEIDAHLGGILSRYKEYFLGTRDKCGYAITLGEFKAKRK